MYILIGFSNHPSMCPISDYLLPLKILLSTCGAAEGKEEDRVGRPRVVLTLCIRTRMSCEMHPYT